MNSQASGQCFVGCSVGVFFGKSSTHRQGASHWLERQWRRPLPGSCALSAGISRIWAGDDVECSEWLDEDTGKVDLIGLAFHLMVAAVKWFGLPT